VRDPRGGKRASGERAVPGLAVAGHGLHEEAEEAAGGAVGERAVPAHAVAPAEEARPEHVVRATAHDRLEHPLEVARVVLAVTVEIDGSGVTLVTRELEAGAKGGTEAARDGMRLDPRTVFACDAGGGVARAVVDEKHVDVQSARARRDAGNDSTDGDLLVASNHDRQAPRAGFHVGCAA
jgi:hypothetical protein